jgi:hypothetical protein
MVVMVKVEYETDDMCDTRHQKIPAKKVITFSGVAADFVLKVCENLLAHTDPRKDDQIVFGGVHLRMYVETHWAGFERYMLIGQDWTVGFNLRAPETEGEIYRAFGSDMELFTPHVTGDREFLRDATILMMTASDWSDEVTPMIW